MPDSEPHVLLEKRGRVGIITLNRPERLNAWSRDMARLVREYITDCNNDDGIGAVVLTGAGRGFCSGADLQRPRSEDGQRPAPEPEQESLTEFLQRSKPLVAAINGAAVGVGFTLPLACDIRIASENARVSMRFIRIGLTPELRGRDRVQPGHARALGEADASRQRGERQHPRRPAHGG